ncbi:trimeric intracellular cation channel family protein [Geomonas sp. RF6]|uniref:trimeric intracellular cation channel family protein n=1 Tax=Geomonas sp. RF6 TaxID=2897342 RepID=UPI001E41A1CF|nr:trimeric intracellular cation channel family protein [Geomonas sp. RF6]UFS72827.1 trimeric intracellular cation channel family protein [Geomonas sp. RF6]
MANNEIVYALDLLGTAAFAASGALAGVRRGMDIFGVIVLGVVTATGGGVMRDLLLNDTPPFCFKNELYLYLAVVASVIVFLTPRRFERMRKAMLILDALGLGTFLVIGTSKALSFHLGFMGSVIMGVMTGTFGGMMRDVLSNEIPLILKHEIYASACAVGGALFYALHQYGVPEGINLTASALLVITIRCVAIIKGWQLPRGKGMEQLHF